MSDGYNCAPEECGGTRMDPCAFSIRTADVFHDNEQVLINGVDYAAAVSKIGSLASPGGADIARLIRALFAEAYHGKAELTTVATPLLARGVLEYHGLEGVHWQFSGPPEAGLDSMPFRDQALLRALAQAVADS